MTLEFIPDSYIPDILFTEPKKEPKDPGYADKGSHGKRHDYQEEVRKQQKICNGKCVSCPIAKSCTK